MSNFLAVAAVSATLRRMLGLSLPEDVTGATATTQRPDAANTLLPTVGVNIYLYQVSPNSCWRNADLPTRTPAGQVVQRPMMALDLHYLMTFYGADAELEPQRVMGSVVRTLHARPIITREMIRATLDAAEVEDPNHYLLASDLAEEVERVKMTPLPLSLEELSKLWSVLIQTHYSLSLAYVGSVVLIEAPETAERALPVRRRGIVVSPFRRAVIEEVCAADGGQAVVMNGTIQIVGSQLDGPLSFVRVGVADLQPVTDSTRSNRLDVALTDSSLRAGVQGVQLVYDDGSESNVAALVLRPIVIPDQLSVTAHAVPIGFNPPVSHAQRVLLYLNEINPPETRHPHAYRFEAPADNGITDPSVESTMQITFAIHDVEPGDYLVRARVGGAENVLGMGLIDGVNQYNTPSVTIP